MSYNLTERQKDFARWLVQAIQEKRMPEEFLVSWTFSGGSITPLPSNQHFCNYVSEPSKPIEKGVLDALEHAGLLIIYRNMQLRTGGTKKSPKAYESERSRRCIVTARLSQAVTSDFAEPSVQSPITLNYPQFAGGFAENVYGDQIGGVINNSESGPMSFDEAAGLTQNTLEISNKLNPYATESEQVDFIRATIQPTQRQRFISAIRSASSAAIDEIPYGPVLKALVEGWRNPGQ